VSAAFESPATAAAPDAMPVQLLDWRPFARGSLRGFCRVRLGAMILNDVTVLESNGRAWAGLPGKPLLSADGVGLRDEKGKQRYTPVVEWANRESGDRFSAGVIAAVQREHGAAALAAPERAA
jgi:hypothetical protein